MEKLLRNQEETKNSNCLKIPRDTSNTMAYSLSALMMAVSTCLHWIASQGFYFIESYDNGFEQLTLVVYQIPLPIIVLATIWTVLNITLTVFYTRPQRSAMPFMYGSARVAFASCCSLTDLPATGIMWGGITETPDSEKRKAGFAPTAGEIVEEAWYS
jgi:hypothetical protein